MGILVHLSGVRSWQAKWLILILVLRRPPLVVMYGSTPKEGFDIAWDRGNPGSSAGFQGGGRVMEVLIEEESQFIRAGAG